MADLEVFAIQGLPEITPGDDLGNLLCAAIEKSTPRPKPGDILLVTQKIVSKAEGQIVRLSEVEPSPFAYNLARHLKKDPRQIEVVLREARRIVRMDKGILITETHHGFVCANSGVDKSNVQTDCVTLLPKNPDLSAKQLRDRLRSVFGVDVAVIITDSWGRPWRNGIVNFAIGSAGINPLVNYVGQKDPFGYVLNVTAMAITDELAPLLEIVGGKLGRVPAVLVRGCQYEQSEGGSAALLRAPEADLFR